MRRRLAACLLLAVSLAEPAFALEFDIEAPPGMAPLAERIRALDPGPIERALALAGLEAPARVRLSLVPEDDPRSTGTPRWIVAYVSGSDEATVFPDRVGSYPYDSLESVITHEVAHLALAARAGGRPLPRWFHEGVAVSVESGWGVLSDARLFLAALSSPGLDDLTRLFAGGRQQESADAYLLATAVIADVRQRHGLAAPGRVAARVGDGMPFARAFELETGETPEAAAARAWVSFRRWTTWLPIITDGTALWSGILVLASLAFLVRMRKRARRRRQWDEEEPGLPMDE